MQFRTPKAPESQYPATTKILEANTPLFFDSLDSFNSIGCQSRNSTGSASHWLLLALTLLLCACDTGGGSGGGSSSASAGSGSSGSSGSSVGAIQVIDLPAGVTEVTLGWEPSDGTIEGYSVYESRNGNGTFFVEQVDTPRAAIRGSAGDAVRITVIAIGESGKPSNSSPPSPELRFHAAEPEIAVAVEQSTAAVRTAGTVAANDPTAGTATSDESAASTRIDSEIAAGSPASDGRVVEDFGATEIAEESSPADAELDTSLDTSIRSLLVEPNARFPLAGLDEDAQGWMQARVEEEFNAGVQLVGTGELDRDGLRELIWRDPSGQLFISTGLGIVEVDHPANIPSTFLEGVRLGATERFVALADWTGDGIGEWLIEDNSTGDVWLVDSETLEATSARSGFETADSLLVAHGDFNGDGRQELLWQELNGDLRFGHPSGDVSGLESPDGVIPVAAMETIIAVADMNGDGNDDLLSTDENGRLIWTLAIAYGSGLRFESQVGPDVDTYALEMLFTLDLDDDGRAEIAWLNNESAEIWNP